ncbi:MAG: cytochrome P450 [Parvibaculum sp.]
MTATISTDELSNELTVALVSRLTAASTISDPYPLYDRLRTVAPVKGYRDFPPGTVPGQDEPVDAWVLLSYEHVAAAARDHRTFSSADPLQEGSSAPTLMLVNHDNPKHDRLRNIVNLAFSRKNMEAEKGSVRAIVDDLVSRLGADDVDVMDAVASVLPARVMVHMLGLPPKDADYFRHWATAFMLSADLTADERQKSNEELAAYFIEKVSSMHAALEKGEPVADCLMRALLTAEADGEKLNLDEVIRFCITLVVAGAETTTFLIGNLLYNLATMPAVHARLKGDISLLDCFIDETLRHSGPPQRLFRIATADVTVGDAEIKEGDWVALFFGAANHDASIFSDPHKFDMDRPNLNRQLTLGVGIHHCLGSALAKLEARTLLEALIERQDDIALGNSFPVPQTASLLNHGFERLTVKFLSPNREAA